jgi:SNF2 family DNA or RNA helicase
VGLGKTIEAGLIIRELKVRGLAKRILVVAPAGLVSQWVSELDTHFNETFHLVQPGNFAAWRQLLGVGPEENLWKQRSQVVCTLDFRQAHGLPPRLERGAGSSLQPRALRRSDQCGLGSCGDR